MMTSVTREGRFSEEEVRGFLKKICQRNNWVVFKCLDGNNVVYTLGDGVGIVSGNLKIVERLNSEYFFNRLDIYNQLSKEDEDKSVEPLFKLLKVDHAQSAKLFTGVLSESNKATVNHMKCLNGTFNYNHLSMEGAVTLLEKFITGASYDSLRALFLKIKSSGWDAKTMACAFAVFLERNKQDLNLKTKDRDEILSQLRVLYPTYVNRFNEVLGIVVPISSLNIFEEPKNFKVIYIDHKLIVDSFSIPFVDTTSEAGYFNALTEFVKYLNTIDGLALLGAKSLEVSLGGIHHKGKWAVMMTVTDDFSSELFRSYIIKCFEKLSLLSTQSENLQGSANGVNSHYLLMGMCNLYPEILEKSVQEVMVSA